MNAYEERIYDMQEAKEEGKTEGEAIKALEMAKAMKNDNKPVDEIAKYTGLSKEKIEML